MTISFQTLLPLLFSILLFSASGQKTTKATIEYSHRVLPDGGDYKEVYSTSGNKTVHYSIDINTNGKSRKRRLKKSSDFIRATVFLDSLLATDSYTIQLEQNQFRQLIEDSVLLKRWKINRNDLTQAFDTLNRICLEKKYFGKKFELPVERKPGDSIQFTSIKWYQLESHVVDGTPFQLTFSINSETRFNYANNLFAAPLRRNYAEWLSMYLMQEKFQLFEKRSPIAYYFRNKELSGLIIQYIVWKKYGLPN